MRIAFVGKGGSGKTTLSSLFSKSIARAGKSVIAIDADINQHFVATFGDDDCMRKVLGSEQKWLKKLFLGERKIDVSEMIKTTPPGRGSYLIKSVTELEKVLKEFILKRDGVAILNVGEQGDEDIGIRCYHSKTGIVELILNHCIDAEDEYIVIDMTAGADAFASGLYDKFDLTVIVVEPTQKSIDVFRQYAGQAKKMGVLIKAVGNKVIDSADEAFLRQQIGDDLIAIFSHSSAVRSAERGRILQLGDLERENTAALQEIRLLLDAQVKNWPRYLARTIEIHRKNAQSWGNTATGVDLEAQIDPGFSYPI